MKLAFLVASLLYGIFITPEPPCDDLKVKAKVTHTTEGKDNGSVEIEVEGGEKPYSFFFLDKDFNPIKHELSKSIINGLPKGKVKYIIRDKNECFQSEDLIIQ